MAVCGLMLLSDAALWTEVGAAHARGRPAAIDAATCGQARPGLAVAGGCAGAGRDSAGIDGCRVLGFFAQISFWRANRLHRTSIIGILLYATPFLLAGARIRQDPVWLAS